MEQSTVIFIILNSLRVLKNNLENKLSYERRLILHHFDATSTFIFKIIL